MDSREYAERVLGKAISGEQLDQLFELLPTARPVVIRKRGTETRPVHGAVVDHVYPAGIVTRVELREGHHPTAPIAAWAEARQNPADQFNRRVGVAIAFGRALKNLRIKTRQEAGDRAAVH
jgi:hypothetical protein